MVKGNPRKNRACDQQMSPTLRKGPQDCGGHTTSQGAWIGEPICDLCDDRRAAVPFALIVIIFPFVLIDFGCSGQPARIPESAQGLIFIDERSPPNAPNAPPIELNLELPS